MLHIVYQESLGQYLSERSAREFQALAEEKGMAPRRESFGFVAKVGEGTAGVLAGNVAYREVHIGTLTVWREYRGQGIGRALLEAAETHYRDKGMESITLTTYGFQAPEFYKKCGYTLEFVRESRENEALNKYFFIKYL